MLHRPCYKSQLFLLLNPSLFSYLILVETKVSQSFIRANRTIKNILQARSTEHKKWTNHANTKQVRCSHIVYCSPCSPCSLFALFVILDEFSVRKECEQFEWANSEHICSPFRGPYGRGPYLRVKNLKILKSNFENHFESVEKVKSFEWPCLWCCCYGCSCCCSRWRCFNCTCGCWWKINIDLKWFL